MENINNHFQGKKAFNFLKIILSFRDSSTNTSEMFLRGYFSNTNESKF